MAFHCYQPVFNFDHEIERAYENAYSPLLKALEGFPGIKASFHFSGNMLEWLERRHPEYIERIRELVRLRRVELISGGYSEPVMVLIPERDREEQLKMNEEIITRIFGVRPRGAWIAERVWEPALAHTLASAGLKYTIVDDYHILRAGVKKENLFKPCLTRGGSGSITLFPSLTDLRYSMPFRPPEATLDYIKNVTEKAPGDTTCFFFADDGEKFGLWPHTYRLVYEKGWLRDFLLLLEENSGWLQTATYSEVMDEVPPEEVDEVPESSYAEMMKWSGGNFKNFLKKYPEADRMHKRMISVSEMIERREAENDGFASGARLREAKKELFKAQSSCAYWHGTFGGLYLPHLRSGVYRHLIQAQNMIDAARKDSGWRVSAMERDLGGSRSETVIAGRLIEVFVKSFGGGGVSELDYKPMNVNLVNTMSRVREDYHDKLKWTYGARIKKARKALAQGHFADVHDALGVGERGLRRILAYDDYQRLSFLTQIFKDRRPWKQLWRARASHDSFLKGAYASDTRSESGSITHTLSRRDSLRAGGGKVFDLEVIKKITVGSGPDVKFAHRILKHSGGPLSLRYAVEFNFLVWDGAVRARPKLTRTDRFSLKDMYSGIGLDFYLDRKFTVFMYPVYTVNETEAGLKKTFQGVSVLIGDEFAPGDDSAAGEMEVTVAISGGSSERLNCM